MSALENRLGDEIKRLRGFVMKYSGHSKPCPFFMGYECECGFAKIAVEFGIDLERDQIGSQYMGAKVLNLEYNKRQSEMALEPNSSS